MDKPTPQQDQRITAAATRFAKNLKVADYSPLALAAYAYIEGALAEMQRLDKLKKEVERHIRSRKGSAAAQYTAGELAAFEYVQSWLERIPSN